MNWRDRMREALKAVHLKWQLHGIEKRNPILVYQMGKVGSSTVVHTLRAAGLSRQVVHVHTLNADHLRRAVEKQRQSIRPTLPEHLIVSSVLVPGIQRGWRPRKVITLTRDPIARAVSFVFEDWYKKAPHARTADGGLDPDAMFQAVLRLLEAERGHADPTRWFEREIDVVLGVDVFSVPYDHERGYTIVSNGVTEVLVMRMEDLNRAFEPAIEAFLPFGSQQISMKRANVGAGKWYAEAMREVRQTLELGSESIDRILDTRYARHFYGPDLDRIRARWLTGKPHE